MSVSYCEIEINSLNFQVLGFLPLRYCPLVFGTICALWSFPPILNKILFEGKGKNGSTVAVSMNRNADYYYIKAGVKFKTMNNIPTII